MTRNIFITIILSLFLISSCDMKEEYENEMSEVVDLAGEWFVAYYIDGEQIVGTSTLLTYNAAADDGTELWIDDQENFWAFKSKAAVTGAMTFGSTAELENVTYPSMVKIENGQIFEDASVQASGATTDSIYFEVSFDDDGYSDENGDYIVTPYSTVYQCAGVRRTGFLEDE